MFPSEAKKENIRSLVAADALVDELLAPYLAETTPMRLRRERADARAAFDARVEQRARDAEYSPRTPSPDLISTPVPGPVVRTQDSAISPPPAPELAPDADARTLQAAIALGLAPAGLVDDEEA